MSTATSSLFVNVEGMSSRGNDLWHLTRRCTFISTPGVQVLLLKYSGITIAGRVIYFNFLSLLTLDSFVDCTTFKRNYPPIHLSSGKGIEILWRMLIDILFPLTPNLLFTFLCSIYYSLWIFLQLRYCYYLLGEPWTVDVGLF